MAKQLFGSWVADTKELQITSYGVDPSELADELFAEFIRWNVLAATHELHEFMDHVQWKPWSKRQGAVRDRDEAVEELVDVLHFIANLLVAIRADDLELNVIYRRKMNVNADRQSGDGYDSFAKRGD